MEELSGIITRLNGDGRRLVRIATRKAGGLAKVSMPFRLVLMLLTMTGAAAEPPQPLTWWTTPPLLQGQAS